VAYEFLSSLAITKEEWFSYSWVSRWVMGLCGLCDVSHSSWL